MVHRLPLTPSTHVLTGRAQSSAARGQLAAGDGEADEAVRGLRQRGGATQVSVQGGIILWRCMPAEFVDGAPKEVHCFPFEKA
jgi:hypothetical protein